VRACTMALPLLRTSSMPEPDDNNSDRVERHVTYETVSSSSTKGTAITIIIVVVIAIALIAWIVMHMK
jgi:hypothetical protein